MLISVLRCCQNVKTNLLVMSPNKPPSQTLPGCLADFCSLHTHIPFQLCTVTRLTSEIVRILLKLKAQLVPKWIFMGLDGPWPT